MASNHQYFKQGAVLIETEGTYATDAIDGNLGGSATYAYQTFDECELTPISDLLPDDPIRQSFSGCPHDTLNSHCAVRISSALRGATNPGVATGESINALPLFLCSGYASTVVAGVSDTWAPTTTQPSGMTIYRFYRNAEDGNYRLAIATGVRGNFVLTLEPGAVARYEFDGLGTNFEDTADTAAFKFWSDDLAFFGSDGKIILDKDGSTAIVTTSVTATLDKRPRFKVESLGITVDGITYPLSRLTFSPNRSPQPNKDINTGGNVESIYTMPNDRPGGQFQIANTAAAYESFLAAWVGATEVDFSATLNNGTDRLVLSTPGDNIQLYQPARTDVSGKTEWGCEYRINGAFTDPTGDDGHSFVFDAAP